MDFEEWDLINFGPTSSIDTENRKAIRKMAWQASAENSRQQALDEAAEVAISFTHCSCTIGYTKFNQIDPKCRWHNTAEPIFSAIRQLKAREEKP